MLPAINNICDCCDNNQPILQLFDDKCFKIIEGAGIIGSFCLNDFAFPSDSHSCINFNLNTEEEYTLFDNGITSIGSPSMDLISGNLYVRGIMIKIVYPTNNNDGEEVSIVDKNVELWIEDAETLDYKKHPMHNLFILFTNPKSNDPKTLINRIKIVNPSTEFKIKLIGLIIFGKAI
jgi:hypothetical protein